MRPPRVLLALAAAALAAAGCVDDGVGPRAPAELPLVLAMSVAEGVSASESEALGSAFDQVDRFRVVVRDSVTRVLYADTVISVTPGADAYALSIRLPEAALGARLAIEVTAWDGDVQLFVSSLTTGVESTGGEVTAEVPVRYVGPGVRGSIADAAGSGLQGVTVALLRGGASVASATTSSDGSFLFTNVGAGTYVVRPTAPSGLRLCPGERTVTVAGAQSSVVAAFQARASCSVRVLVVSGGDVDDTGAAASWLSGLADVSVGTFFHVAATPGIEALRAWDVVLVFQNGLFDESVALGGELARWVELGGNVVFASFFWQGASGGVAGSAGWGALEAWAPFASAGGASYAPATLGSVVAHELTAGVSAISSNGYRGGVSAGGTVVATWSDGVPFIGYSTGPAGQRFVAVSLFPGGGATGDVARVWQNAVQWAGAAGGPARTGPVAGR